MSWLSHSCQTCTHYEEYGRELQSYIWESREAYEDYKEGEPQGLMPWGICQRIDGPYSPNSNKTPDKLAFVQDASEYEARLWVSPVFACILWEEKDE
jgi:hypothetical protein